MACLRTASRTWWAGLLALAMLVTACDVSDLPRDPHTLTVAVNAEITTLDPARTLLATEQIAMDLAYERLVRFEPGGGLRGELAERIEPSADRREWTAYLHPGHRFDDGSEVTAEAVKFTFDRIKKAKRGPAQALMWLRKVEVIDPRTVRFHLSQPLPFFASLLALAPGGIVNPAIMAHEVDGDLASRWLGENTAGSGPYRVVRMQQGDRVVLEVNPHASKPPVYFRRVVLKTVRDETERLMQLGKGDVDLVDGVAPDRLGWLRSRPGIRVESGVPRTVSFLQLNNERKPLNDVRVRRAISLAIDREQILNRVIRGGGALVHGVLPPGVPGHDPSLPLPTYDPAAARQLLSEAGVAPGTKLILTVASDAESGPGSPSVLALQEQLGRVGLDVELRQITQGARAELFRGNFDLALQSIQLDFPDPWIMFTFLYDSRLMGTMGDMARYRNPALEQKLAEADNTPDPQRRAELYRDAQRMVVNDMPNVPLYQPGWHVALRDDIDGLRYDYSQLLFINAQDMRRSASTAGKEH